MALHHRTRRLFPLTIILCNLLPSYPQVQRVRRLTSEPIKFDVGDGVNLDNFEFDNSLTNSDAGYGEARSKARSGPGEVAQSRGRNHHTDQGYALSPSDSPNSEGDMAPSMGSKFGEDDSESDDHNYHSDDDDEAGKDGKKGKKGKKGGGKKGGKGKGKGGKKSGSGSGDPPPYPTPGPPSSTSPPTPRPSKGDTVAPVAAPATPLPSQSQTPTEEMVPTSAPTPCEGRDCARPTRPVRKL